MCAAAVLTWGREAQEVWQGGRPMDGLATSCTDCIRQLLLSLLLQPMCTTLGMECWRAH